MDTNKTKPTDEIEADGEITPDGQFIPGSENAPQAEANAEEAAVVGELAQEAEIGSLTSEAQVMNQLGLENLIKKYLKDIEKLKQEIKDKSAMFKDAFENDSVYREYAEKVQEANKLKNTAREKILKQDSVAMLADELRSLKDDSKDLQQTLSDCLTRYTQMTDTKQIEDDDGEIREIVAVLKLVKKSAQFKPKN